MPPDVLHDAPPELLRGDDVAHLERLRDEELEPADEVPDEPLRGEAERDAADARERQEAGDVKDERERCNRGRGDQTSLDQTEVDEHLHEDWRSQLTPSSPRSAAKCAALQSSSAEEGWASSGDGDPTVGPLAERGGGSLAAQMYLASTTLSAARRKRKVNTWNQCRYPPVLAAPSAPIFWSAKRAVLDAHPEKVAEEKAEVRVSGEGVGVGGGGVCDADAEELPLRPNPNPHANPEARRRRGGPVLTAALVDHAGAPMRAARRETVLHSERDHRLMY